MDRISSYLQTRIEQPSEGPHACYTPRGKDTESLSHDVAIVDISLDMIQREALQVRDIILNNVTTDDRDRGRNKRLKPTLSASL